jgi:hypothetical protein
MPHRAPTSGEVGSVHASVQAAAVLTWHRNAGKPREIIDEMSEST